MAGDGLLMESALRCISCVVLAQRRSLRVANRVPLPLLSGNNFRMDGIMAHNLSRGVDRTHLLSLLRLNNGLNPLLGCDYKVIKILFNHPRAGGGTLRASNLQHITELQLANLMERPGGGTSRMDRRRRFKKVGQRKFRIIIAGSLTTLSLVIILMSRKWFVISCDDGSAAVASSSGCWRK